MLSKEEIEKAKKIMKFYKNYWRINKKGGIQMPEKEQQYRKVNNEYTNFSYMFYESMRDNGQYDKPDVNKQITKLIKELTTLRKMK